MLTDLHEGLLDASSAAILGGGLPLTALRHLESAGAAFRDDARAEEHLRLAREAAPEHPAVLIGFYRYYFYKNRLRDALAIAEACIDKAMRENQLGAAWREARRGTRNWARYDDLKVRFLLFSLKGYAYLKLRLGETEEAREAIGKLLELDPSDKIGARVLSDVLARRQEPEDE